MQPRLPFLKPKPSTGSVFSPVVSKSLTADSSQCPTLDGKNVCRSLSQCKQILSESISTQMLIEASKKDRTNSSSQKQETVALDVPHEIRSILPPNNNIKSISSSHYVVFPPEIPPEYRNYCRSITSSPLPKHEINVETKSEYMISSAIRKEDYSISKSTLVCPESNNIPKLNENENLRTEISDTIQKHGMNNKTKSDCTISSAVHPVEIKLSQSYDEFLETIEPNYVHEFRESENSITKTSDFGRENPILSTEPIVESKSSAYTAKDDKESSIVAALKTDSGRSDSPLPTLVDSSELIPTPIEPAIEPMTMADALTIASDRSYKLPESSIKRPVGNNPVRYMHGYNKKTPMEPLLMTRHLIYAPTSAVDSKEEEIASLGLKSFPPISDDLKLSTASGDFDRTESNFDNAEEFVFDDLKFEEPIKLLNKEMDVVEPVVDEPLDKLQCQQSIQENLPRASFSETFPGKLIGPGIQDKVSLFMPKLSIEDTSFSKQKPNVHGKSSIALDSASSSLGDSSSKNSDSITYKSNNSETNSSNYTPVETLLKSRISTKSIEESIPLTPHTSQTDNTLVEPVTPTFKSSLPAAFLSKQLTCLMKKQQPKCIPSPIPKPDIGGQPTGRAGVSAGLTAPRRGRGVLNPQNLTPGAREPLCGQCHLYIR